MRSARLTSLVLLAAAIAGGFAIEASDEGTPGRTGAAGPTVEAGVAMPAARPAGSLSSTWYCAGGTATEGSFADHVIILANPTTEPRTATVTALTGPIAEAPAPEVGDDADEEADDTTTTTAAPETTTTTAPVEPASTTIEMPARTRTSYSLRELVDAPLAGAIVEIDGGEVAVEHSVNGELGRATAPCSTTASASWSFPWGVTSRGARELLVFMNPFPDDATVDITFATDEGVRETGRFQGFVVPGRSVVGAFIDQDVQRRAHVSAQVEVLGGRLVIDRIQMFEGTDEDARRGIVLGLGAPTPAEVWMFPEGGLEEGVTEQVVVFNPSDDVAEVEVEVRLDRGDGAVTAGDPDDGEDGDGGAEGEEPLPVEEEFVPEPYSLTVSPGGFSVVTLPDPDVPERVPTGGHSFVVRSLNGVPVAAERVMWAVDPANRSGIAATLGAPLAAPRWYFPGGGTSESRDEWIVLLNASSDEAVTYDITSTSRGQILEIEGLQGLTLDPGARAAVRIGDHAVREDLPILVEANGPVVVERGLYAVSARGISQSMGIPFSDGIVVPDPLAG